MILSLSHYDLDGISAQIVINRMLGISQKMNVSYGKIDEYLGIVHDFCSHQKPGTVFITDLSFSYEQLVRVKDIAEDFPDTNFFFIDHHPFEEEYDHLRRNNLQIVISEKACATKLTYLYIQKHWEMNGTKELDDYVKYVNAYDIWLDDTPEFKVGFVYNELFWLYKLDHFWARFQNDTKLRNSDKEKYRELIKKKDKLFAKLWKSGRVLDLGDKDLLMIFVDEFNSHITIDYPGYKVYVILNSRGKVSIRLKDIKNTENIKNIKELILEETEKLPHVIACGGHDAAFGVTLESDDPAKLIAYAKATMVIVDKALTKFGEIN